jgi:hypothetical protein
LRRNRGFLDCGGKRSAKPLWEADHAESGVAASLLLKFVSKIRVHPCPSVVKISPWPGGPIPGCSSEPLAFSRLPLVSSLGFSAPGLALLLGVFASLR